MWINKNYQEAVAWYQKAADQGLARAQFILGMLYYEGQGITQDYAKEKEWYGKAAKQGDVTNTISIRMYV